MWLTLGVLAAIALGGIALIALALYTVRRVRILHRRLAALERKPAELERRHAELAEQKAELAATVQELAREAEVAERRHLRSLGGPLGAVTYMAVSARDTARSHPRMMVVVLVVGLAAGLALMATTGNGHTPGGRPGRQADVAAPATTEPIPLPPSAEPPQPEGPEPAASGGESPAARTRSSPASEDALAGAVPPDAAPPEGALPRFPPPPANQVTNPTTTTTRVAAPDNDTPGHEEGCLIRIGLVDLEACL